MMPSDVVEFDWRGVTYAIASTRQANQVVCLPNGHKLVIRSWRRNGRPNVIVELDSSNAPPDVCIWATVVR